VYQKENFNVESSRDSLASILPEPRVLNRLDRLNWRHVCDRFSYSYRFCYSACPGL